MTDGHNDRQTNSNDHIAPPWRVINNLLSYSFTSMSVDSTVRCSSHFIVSSSSSVIMAISHPHLSTTVTLVPRHRLSTSFVSLCLFVVVVSRSHDNDHDPDHWSTEYPRNGARYRRSYNILLIGTYALLNSVISNDLEWLSKMFSDTKHRAVSLR